MKIRRIDGRGKKLLHSAAHSLQQELRIELLLGGGGDDLYSGTEPTQLRRQGEAGFRPRREPYEHHIGNGLSGADRPLASIRKGPIHHGVY
ncbi:MAG: hypothetical protein IH846_12760 [Acidobacteria bacterium]|nr:hypothetical protein [Acidobacteriota bacterium]